LTLNLGLRVEIAGGVSEVNNVQANLDPSKPAPIGAAGAARSVALILAVRRITAM
jgi:hypothetical protein